MELNSIEKEIIYLCAINQLIDEMVNFELFDLLGGDPHIEIRFKSMTHKKFFNIMLVDFLSCADSKILGERQPYLKALTSICGKPNFNYNNSVNSLKDSTQNFRDWLDKECTVKNVWLPTIDLEIDLEIKRIEFIKICGNISKHNFTRLSSATKEITAIFERNNITLSPEDSISILEDFYEWFHNDIFSYHSSAIAEFMNNIRLDIHEYLQPEYNQSITYFENDPVRYEYTYPKNVNNKFAKECYWNLMNKIRSKSYMKRFEVTKYLKMRY